MTAKEILNTVNEVQSLLSFTYRGKEGNIDPYGSIELNRRWLLFYDGLEVSVYGEDAVLNTPFIDGKTLSEVAEALTDIEW